MNILNIFKREKAAVEMPEPKFEDNWRQEQFERNIKEGVAALQKGKYVNIYDDGRGYELALRIKQDFMLEYQKRLAESIDISVSGTITVSLKTSPTP